MICYQLHAMHEFENVLMLNENAHVKSNPLAGFQSRQRWEANETEHFIENPAFAAPEQQLAQGLPGTNKS